MDNLSFLDDEERPTKIEHRFWFKVRVGNWHENKFADEVQFKFITT